MTNRLSEVQAAAVAAGIYAVVVAHTPDNIRCPLDSDMVSYWLGKIDEILTAPEVSGEPAC